MSLTVGDKLGPYEILAAIGAGGMGEVWKARDTRLDRIVAIKTSTARFSERFEREARAVAALNHPHICTLYDVGADYLVMEYVEGAEIRGPMPVDRTLKLAIQLASALEAAHRKGITHRDLKPANILLAKSGVKVLDFGLAKTERTKAAAVNDSNDETLTRALTQEGSIVGTLQYMAPEQLQGKATDVRADIFSFGSVFYEMLTGKRAFDAANTASVIAAILERPAPTAGEGAPPLLEWTLQRCLAKDPDDRWQTAADLRAALELCTVGMSDVPETRREAHRLGLAWVVTVLAAGIFASVAAGLAFVHFRETPPHLQPAQFIVEAPAGKDFTNPYAATSVSPDGRYLVFGAGSPAGTSLWIRPMDSVTARELPGTEGGTMPFWSPDDKSIAFYTTNKLKRIEIAGGPPQILCEIEATYSAGGTWSRDGTILFASGSGLMRVPAGGGSPQKVAEPDPGRKETAYGLPQFLPDGKHYLYFVSSADASTQGIYVRMLPPPGVRPLNSPKDGNAGVRIVATDHKAYYSPPVNGSASVAGTGHLLWLRDQTLLAQPFNESNLRLEGEPLPVADSVATTPQIRAAFWVSDAGILTYRHGDPTSKHRFVWTGKDGGNLEDLGKSDTYGSFRLSPDGKRVAFDRTGETGKDDLWVLEFGRSVMSRLTFNANNAHAVWSPDGRQIAYASDRSGVDQIYRKDAGGASEEEQLTNGPNPVQPEDWSRDGRYLLYSEQGPTTGFDLWAIPLGDDRKPFAVLQTAFAEHWAQFSPDGKWIAYQSNQSGKTEIYIRPFNIPGGAQLQGQWQVSNAGGALPRWRSDGKELYYLASDRAKILAANVRIVGESVQTDAPHELFAVSLGAFGAFRQTSVYDVTADGQRFLVEAADAERAPATLTVMLNWQAGLKK